MAAKQMGLDLGEEVRSTLCANDFKEPQVVFQPIPINTMLATRHNALGRGTGFGVGEAGDPQFTISTAHEHAVCYAEVSENAVFEAAGFKAGQGVKARSIGWEEEKSPTLASEAGGNSVPSVCVKYYESHPMDSRIKELEDDVSPTVSVKWHKGAADTPLVCTGEVIPIHDKATRYQGGGPTRNGDGAGNGFGVGQPGDPVPTLSTCDRHMVAYAMQGFGDYKESEVSSGLKARDYKDATDLVCGVDVRNMNEYPELYPTLQAKPNGGQSLNFSGAVRVRYIVRRLTPTECARLQGFPDEWGHPDHMDTITDGDYRFWLNVRKTHAAINGKSVRDYTEEQIMSWYNKLHTDSAEYKLWGNGIALPCALYVLEGIAEVSEA